MEAQARQAAIDAVEGRWRHDQDVARRARRRKVAGNIVSITVLLVILVAILLYFKAQRDGGKLRFGMEGSKVALSVVKEAQCHVEYKRVSNMFDVEETVPWKKAPASVRPRKAPVGTKYYARIARSSKADDFDLYEMTKTEKGVSVVRLSPTREPIRVGDAEFRKARARAPYLVACDGTVYACDAKSGGE